MLQLFLDKLSLTPLVTLGIALIYIHNVRGDRNQT
jgi:hypothetical protein